MRGEGRLEIEIGCAAGAAHVSIASSRPLHLAQALVGMGVKEALATVPMLFAVCAQAQIAAAAEAIAAARGEPLPRAAKTAQRLLVMAEAAREHLIAAVRDWAQMADMAPASADLASILRWFLTTRAQIEQRALTAPGSSTDGELLASIARLRDDIERLVLNEPCENFLARPSAGDFWAWGEVGCTPAQRLAFSVLLGQRFRDGEAALHPLGAGCAIALAPQLFGAERRAFSAAPEHAGGPCETTALVRQRAHPMVQDLMSIYGPGVAARMAARLVEIARLPQDLETIVRDDTADVEPWLYGATRIGTGAGISEIETVRGRLIHAVGVEHDRVTHYAIVAPTEWNFHPRGVAAQGIASIVRSGCEALARVRTFVRMLDPCVAFEARAA